MGWGGAGGKIKFVRDERKVFGVMGEVVVQFKCCGLEEAWAD